MVSDGQKHVQLYIPHCATSWQDTFLFLIAFFSSLASTQMEQNRRTPLKTVPSTYSVNHKLMYIHKYPTLSLHYSLSIVQEVWTIFDPVTALTNAKPQLKKVIPYVPIIAMTPPD